MVEIYTDGACSGNPGKGGYAALILKDDGTATNIVTGKENPTTNNRMELLGMIEGLKLAKRHRTPSTIYTDSEYVRNGMTNWIHSWKRSNWVTSSGKPVANKELWIKIDDLYSKLRTRVRIVRVVGHSGNKGNDLADYYARTAMG